MALFVYYSGIWVSLGFKFNVIVSQCMRDGSVVSVNFRKKSQLLCDYM